jgi:hypothetical protein
MNKGIGSALLIGGIVLVIYGFNALDSVSSEVLRAFMKTSTEKTMGDAVAIIVGALMAFRSRKFQSRLLPIE